MVSISCSKPEDPKELKSREEILSDIERTDSQIAELEREGAKLRAEIKELEADAKD